MPEYHDVDGEIVTTETVMRGVDKKGPLSDGAIRFKLIGGPYHDLVFRVYPPFDVIRWPDRANQDRHGNPSTAGGFVYYELNPPMKPGGPWTYVFNPERTETP